MRSLKFTIVAALVAATSCSNAPVITITNHSSFTLSNVVVSGSGFSSHIGSIEAGGKHRVKVHPSGESGVRLMFDAGRKHVDSGEQGYFKAGGGYRVEVTVGTNLNVSVSEDLRKY